MVEFVDEGQVIRDYGETVPAEFGGIYGEGGRLVALFTTNLEHHLVELRARLPFPEQVRVDEAARPWREVDAASKNVADRLLRRHRHPCVTSVDIGMEEGQFVVVVGVHPYDENVVRSVREDAAPYEVTVRPMGPARLL